MNSKSGLVLIIIFMGMATLMSATVESLEYWFDTDPGQGNGTPLNIRNTVEFDLAIGTSALEPGIHRLFLRARTDEGLWGLPQSKVFYIPCTAPALEEGSVAAVEYWFDVDPGQGNGTHAFGRSAIELDTVIATASLSPGIHRLFVRSQNSDGIWGLPHSTVFYIPYTAPPLEEGSIAAVEYWFDADPGQGNGTHVFGRNAVELDTVIATATLDSGIHRLFVRSQNSDGIWGLPNSLSFLIPKAPPLPPEQIVRLEYFIDTDPGFGNGNGVVLGPGNPVSIDISALIGTISHGNHSLYLRAQNSDGGWGFPASCLFSDGIPANLGITVANGMIMLIWEDLYQIDSYKVYSAAQPGGTYVWEEGGTYGEASWTAPATDLRKFFHVSSIYEEGRINSR